MIISVHINTPHINLGQFLKFINLISCGSQAKFFLSTEKILVNGFYENRRGKKLYHNDLVVINEQTYVIIVNQEN